MRIPPIEITDQMEGKIEDVIVFLQEKAKQHPEATIEIEVVDIGYYQPHHVARVDLCRRKQ